MKRKAESRINLGVQLRRETANKRLTSWNGKTTLASAWKAVTEFRVGCAEGPGASCDLASEVPEDSSEAALAMAALTTSFGAGLSATLVATAATDTEPPNVDRHATENCGRMQETSMSYVQSEQSEEQETRRVIDSFGETFSRRDADGLAALLTEDTVFEDTSPAPDGRRIEGRAAVVEFWRGWFARNPDASFETEEIIVCGKRAVVRWVYRKMRTGQPWHLRGVDIFAVRNGRVAAKLAYVKG